MAHTVARCVVLPAPRGGRCAGGLAKPVPRPLLEGAVHSDLSDVLELFFYRAGRGAVTTRHCAAVMLSALWWGSLTGLGFLVVPLLFKHIATPAAAGAMAAKLFTAQTWLGIACAMLLLLMCNKKDALAQDSSAHPAMKFIVAGLLLAVLVEFGLSPRIVSARAEGGNLKLWHGLGSAMYLGQWLCAGLSLWLLSRPVKSSPD